MTDPNPQEPTPQQPEHQQRESQDAESYKFPPCYEEKSESQPAPYHDDPEDNYTYDDIEDIQDQRSSSLCRIFFYVGFFVLWVLLYIYFLHIPGIMQKMYGTRREIREMKGEEVRYPGFTPPEGMRAPMQMMPGNSKDVPGFGGKLEEVEVQVEKTVIVNPEHGVVIEAISITPKNGKGSVPFAKPPPFVEARRRNPFVPLRGAPAAVMVKIEGDESVPKKQHVPQTMEVLAPTLMG